MRQPRGGSGTPSKTRPQTTSSVGFVPVERLPESALGLVWHRDGETAAVREFVRALAGRGVSLGDAQVVA
ncbi:hypothetical protein CA983_31455 [Streptomyces swartbergensis]|uniref:LysR family transcriptional regulator n=2 Tax=Streptomyces swartbergensis TaxID=487165 RepID=A0A243RP09_9ACTN|nr:hypothetical protein CA983_31455 [Streptomyces swartbergensis]